MFGGRGRAATFLGISSTCVFRPPLHHCGASSCIHSQSRHSFTYHASPSKARADEGLVDWEYAVRELDRVQSQKRSASGERSQEDMDAVSRAEMLARELEQSRQEQRALAERLRQVEAAALRSPSSSSVAIESPALGPAALTATASVESRPISPPSVASSPAPAAAPAALAVPAALEAPASPAAAVVVAAAAPPTQPVFRLSDAARARLVRAVRAWRAERTLLRLLKAEAPSLRKANLFSKEMDKLVAYQFALLSKTPFALDACVTFIGDPR